MNITKSISLFQEAQNLFPGGVNSPVRAFRAVGGNPFFAARAKGSRVDFADASFHNSRAFEHGWSSALTISRPDIARRRPTGGLTLDDASAQGNRGSRTREATREPSAQAG